MDTNSRARVGAGIAPLGVITAIGTMAAGTASAAVSTATATTAASTAHPGCGLGAWTGKVQGAPVGFAAGAHGGDYLWHTTQGSGCESPTAGTTAPSTPGRSPPTP